MFVFAFNTTIRYGHGFIKLYRKHLQLRILRFLVSTTSFYFDIFSRYYKTIASKLWLIKFNLWAVELFWCAFLRYGFFLNSVWQNYETSQTALQKNVLKFVLIGMLLHQEIFRGWRCLFFGSCCLSKKYCLIVEVLKSYVHHYRELNRLLITWNFCEKKVSRKFAGPFKSS